MLIEGRTSPPGPLSESELAGHNARSVEDTALLGDSGSRARMTLGLAGSRTLELPAPRALPSAG